MSVEYSMRISRLTVVKLYDKVSAVAIRFEDERERDHDGSVSGGPAAARLVGGRVHAPGTAPATCRCVAGSASRKPE